MDDYQAGKAVTLFISFSSIHKTVTNYVSYGLWYVAYCTVRKRRPLYSVEVFFDKGYAKSWSMQHSFHATWPATWSAPWNGT